MIISHIALRSFKVQTLEANLFLSTLVTWYAVRLNCTHGYWIVKSMRYWMNINRSYIFSLLYMWMYSIFKNVEFWPTHLQSIFKWLFASYSWIFHSFQPDLKTLETSKHFSNFCPKLNTILDTKIFCGVLLSVHTFWEA